MSSRSFVTDINDVYHRTGMPPLPCMFHHMCLPFSPICAIFICAYRRKSGLKEAVDGWNSEHQEEGIYFAWNANALFSDVYLQG